MESSLERGGDESDLIKEARDESYTPVAIRRNNSRFGALAHMLKVHLGVGILTMPYVISKSGTILGPIVILFLSAVYYKAIIYLSDASDKILQNKDMEFAELNIISELAFKSARTGAFMRAFVGTNIVGLHLGIWLPYMLMIETNIRAVLYSIYPSLKDDPHLRVKILLVIAVLLILVCSIPDLDGLVPLSTAGLIAILIGLGIMMIYSAADIKKLPEYPSANFWHVFMAYGMIMFAFEGVGSLMSIKNSMREPEHFTQVFRIMMSGYASLLVVVGLIGYGRFGAATKVLLIANMPANKLFLSVKALHAIAVFASYPVTCVVTNRIMVPNANRIFGCCFKEGSVYRSTWLGTHVLWCL